MKLVKIDESLYLNPESIGAIKDDYLGTNIYLIGSDKPIETSVEIKKVLDAICGSEERSFVGYKRLKNNDLVQKAYVDVNNRQDNHYNIIINSDNAGAEVIVTKSEVLNLLNQLKTDETLTIKRT